MAIKIKFDVAGMPEEPTFVLASQLGEKYGQLSDISDVVINGNFQDTDTITFTAHKNDNLWDEIKDFKLVWCREWDKWFQAHVTYTDDEGVFKNVELKGLGESETSQLMVVGYEINTSEDFERTGYIPSILYDPVDQEHSILHRLFKIAPHYTIAHCDASIAHLQRSFSFSSTDLFSALQDIATEVDMYVKFNNGTGEDGMPIRSVSFYDLEDRCLECGYRGLINGTCPECGSSYIDYGYGTDTTICVSTEDIADNVTIDGDEDSMKNCFRLLGGDDLFNATIQSYLPDGSGFYWYITPEQMEDMPPELSAKIAEYKQLYRYYNNEYHVELPAATVSAINALATKYASKFTFDTDFSNIIGFPALNKGIYEITDLSIYLSDGMLPNETSIETTAAKEAAKLTSATMSPIAVPDSSYTSVSTINNAALGLAKAMVNPNYKVKVASGSYSGTVWTGTFELTSYYDENDTATTSTIMATVSSNFKTYLSQRLDKILADTPIEDNSVVTLFKMSNANFTTALGKYNLTSLKYLQEACQSCMDILIENNVSNPDIWINELSDLYNDLYVPYRQKYSILSAAITERAQEVNNVNLINDTLFEERAKIQDTLNMKNFLGSELWKMLFVYRRDETYQNSNYISEGLSTTELFRHVEQFMEVAISEVHRAAVIKKTITANLKNLLVIDEFKPLADQFEVGNFIRAKIEDEIYKFRLLSYQINYEDLSNIDVEFSTVINTYDSADIKKTLDGASSMATSYNATIHQVEDGKKLNNIVETWFEDGLAMTQMKLLNNADNQNMVYDEHGMLMRRLNDLTDEYDPIQMKWINSTLAITDDNWDTTKAVFGKFVYRDPVTGEYIDAYGVNGETVVGRLILGEYLGIYNTNATMKFDKDGLTVVNDHNIININPGGTSLMTIQQLDDNGEVINTPFELFADGQLNLSQQMDGLSSRITQTATSLTTQINNVESGLSSQIQQTASSLTTQIQDTESGLQSQITQNANNIQLLTTETNSLDGRLGSAELSISPENIVSTVTSGDGFNSTMRSVIAQNADSIRLQASNITWKSNYSEMSSNGTLICNAGYIGSWGISTSGLGSWAVLDYNKSRLTEYIYSPYHTNTESGVYISSRIEPFDSSYGTLYIANSASEMTNTSRSYFYNGYEMGMSRGAIYTYNSTRGWIVKSSYVNAWDASIDRGFSITKLGTYNVRYDGTKKLEFGYSAAYFAPYFDFYGQHHIRFIAGDNSSTSAFKMSDVDGTASSILDYKTDETLHVNAPLYTGSIDVTGDVTASGNVNCKDLVMSGTFTTWGNAGFHGNVYLGSTNLNNKIADFESRISALEGA